MLLNLILDDDGVDDGTITAAYQVGPYVLQIKQKPGDGHAVVTNPDAEAAATEDTTTTSSTTTTVTATTTITTTTTDATTTTDTSTGATTTDTTTTSTTTITTAAATTTSDNAATTTTAAAATAAISTTTPAATTTDTNTADSTATTAPAISSSTGGATSISSDEAYPNVGLMVWQSAFVLAEYLLRYPPCKSWEDVTVLELGCGVGIVGVALGAAGAQVVMTDLEHITPLAQDNVDANAALCCGNVRVVPFPWGQDPADAGLTVPDVLVAADVLYEPQHYDKLLDSLVRLTDEWTPLYLCYRHRGSYREETFEPMAQKAGFQVEHISEDCFPTDYQGRGFHLFRMQRTKAPPAP